MLFLQAAITASFEGWCEKQGGKWLEGGRGWWQQTEQEEQGFGEEAGVKLLTMLFVQAGVGG